MQLVYSNQNIKPNFLVYGPAGSRKSYSVTTYTRGPVHILQTEPGRISALDNPQFYAKVQEGYHAVIYMNSNSDFDIIRKGGREAYAAFCERNKLKFPSMIVLDSISWYNTLIIDDVLRKFPPRNGLGIPEINHWMMVSEQTRQLISQLVQTDAIIYIIAQADIREIEEPGIKTTLWIPGIVGKYATQIAHATDMVFFAKPGANGEVLLHCTYTGGHLGKTRGINVKDKTLPFNIDHIISLWEASLEENGGQEPSKNSTQTPTKQPTSTKPQTPTKTANK